jgi:citrate synthase
MDAVDPDYVSTWIGTTTPDTITVAGLDLPSEVMGRLTLTELAYLLVTKREPTAGERRILDAVLVSLADHGLTPSALAARLTYTGAPEAIQGAVAAGLLGAGSVFLGPTGDTADMLAAAVSTHGTDDLDHCAIHIVDLCIDSGRRVPGLGHPIHRDEDPRTPRLYAIAEEEGLLGPHLDLLRRVAVIHEAATGKRLPINGAGAAGAALVDVGVPPTVVRGFVLIARTAGLVAHLLEESVEPIGRSLWLEIDARAAGSADERAGASRAEGREPSR